MESWRRAAPRGAASHLWTKCPEVGQTKCACATQGHASARNDKFIYVLPNFASTAGLILPDGWAFFDRLGGWKRKKDTAIPPGHRRILKKGDFNTPPAISFFEKKTAAWNLLFQNRRKATVFCFGAWIPSRRNNGFFIIPLGGYSVHLLTISKNYRSIFTSLNLVCTLPDWMLLSIQLYKISNCGWVWNQCSPGSHIVNSQW